MKKSLIVACALFFAVAPYAMAQGFVPLAPIPGLTDIQPANGGLATFLNNLYKYIIGLAAVLAVIMIVWGGLEYATQDSVSKKSDGKEKILQAIFGLVLVLSPVLVFSLINPSILNLSLNLDPLKTQPTSSSNSQTTQSVTLTETDKQLREASGGTVLYAFTLDLAKLNTTVSKALKEEQNKCTATNSSAVVLPILAGGGTWGGVNNYTCQTCPPNTSPVLFPSCSANQGCGSCQPK